jgi:hypothetical protein
VPVDVVADKNNNIWAYCMGVPDYSNYPNLTYTNSGISKINVSAKVVNTLPLTTMSASGVNNIAASKDGSIIYYLNDGLYSIPVTATSLPTSKMVDLLILKPAVTMPTAWNNLISKQLPSLILSYLVIENDSNVSCITE